MSLAPTPTVPAALLEVGRPGDPALIAGGVHLTYAELRERVVERATAFGGEGRSLIAIHASNTIEFVVTYLAVLEADHVPLLMAGHAERLVAAWRPMATVTPTATGVDIEHRDAPQRALHPDLRLLLSTSGSTGAPKLVRLSDRNLRSNARSIADYLHLTPEDRAITSLPLHYCYGLSVLHSHLASGASIVLTEASVVHPCFAAAMADHAVTNLAGVPHTFELLERVGPDRIHVPSLRFLTVAGGRLRPDRVEAWSRRCSEWGSELFVMYGQTEATARMAYLPPALARRYPQAIGVPIPGGSLDLRPVEGQAEGIGELVYRGDNVMMGYAAVDADLAAGPELHELRTGDLARYHAEAGVFEIVGRQTRFVKPFGVRIDLDVVEREVAGTWADAAVAGNDDGLTVHAPGADGAAVRAAVASVTGLPPRRVSVTTDGPTPRTTNGKIDYDAVLRGAERPDGDAVTGVAEAPTSLSAVADVYATVLGRVPGPNDTFVALGGDSMNYVECSVRLERVLGHLPADWHLRPVELLEPQPGPRRSVARIDTSVLLRAISICAVVATHMHLRHVPGGAHILLAMIGYNLSRFQIPIVSTVDRLRAGLRTIARTAAPTVAWVAAGFVGFGAYGAGTLALVNNYIGPPGHRDDDWHFWFIEVFVHLCLATTLLLAVPAVRRVERRFPYLFPLALLGLTLSLRMEWAWMGDWYNLRFRTHGIAWFFVLGWLVQRSTTVLRRVATTALLVITINGFFHHAAREWFIIVALTVLVWFSQLPIPRHAVRPVAAIAAASMWILITHFTVWPVLLELLPLALAYPLTIAAGLLAWASTEHGARAARQQVARGRIPWRRRTAVAAAAA